MRPVEVPKEIFERLSPYNWDFRIIPKGLLKYTIRFEYLRSWPEFHRAAIPWLEKKIDGLTIREHLIEASKIEHGNFPPNVWKELPPEWSLHFHDLLDNPAYPVPVAWMVENGCFKERPRKTLEPHIIKIQGKTIEIDMEEQIKAARNRRLVDIHPLNKDRLEFVSKMLSFPEVGESYGYHLEVYFDMHRNEDLVKSFASWIKEEAKKKRTVPARRASSPRWHRLKQLAAKRISDAGLNYKDAWSMIVEREKVKPTPINDKVFPKYGSAGAWHDAVEDANLFVETMKKNLHYEDWELL